MEGKSRVPEITIAPAPRPVADGSAVRTEKTAGKEPISPGTPSSVAAGRSSKESGAEGSLTLPGWKLHALCQEQGPSTAMGVRFLYF